MTQSFQLQLEEWAGQEALPQKGPKRRLGTNGQPPTEGLEGQLPVQRRLPPNHQALFLVAMCSPCRYAVRGALRAALDTAQSGGRDRCHQPGLTWPSLLARQGPSHSAH